MKKAETGWKTWQKWTLAATGVIALTVIVVTLFYHPPKNTPIADAVQAVNESLFKDALINAVVKDSAFTVKAVKIMGDSLFVALDHIEKKMQGKEANYFIHHYGLDSSAVITTCLIYENQPNPFEQQPVETAVNNKKRSSMNHSDSCK